MNPNIRTLYRELYRKSFYDFFRDFWSTVNPEKFVDGKLIQFYCETFQYMCRDWVEYKPVQVELPPFEEDVDIIDVRQNKNKLCINVPPRHCKSQVFNIFGPVWLWTYHHIKVASVSHTAALSTKMNMGRQKLINSFKYRELYGEKKLLQNTTTSLIDEDGGEMYSINRNAFTGYGGDIIINDDLTNAEVAKKDKEEMNNAWSYYRNTMPSRVNNIEKCVIINIQQRLAPNDITGHIQKETKLAEQYTFIVLPAIFKKKTYLVCPITGTIFCFEKGDPLWDERFSLSGYESLRISQGDTVFKTQYMQEPIASDATIVKDEMIVEKDSPDVPNIEQANMIYASHDFPVKEKETSDFLGSILAYSCGSTLYILDCLETKMGFVKSVKYVKQLDDVYPGIIQIIEDKANGSPILQQLQGTVSGIQAYAPGTASKSQRLESASIYMLNNVVFIRSKFDEMAQKWILSENLSKLKSKLLDFPFVDHDDIVDAFSMLLLYVFMDKKNCVYGRSFNDMNVVKIDDITGIQYDNVFFNKEGDTWKVLDIGIKYGAQSQLYVKKELLFKANVDDGLKKLKEFEPTKNVFIDCSYSEGMYGIFKDGITIERYVPNDFDTSVNLLNVAFAYNNVLLDEKCKMTKNDINSFKYDRTKDENSLHYKTEKRWFCCLHKKRNEILWRNLSEKGV